MRRDHGPRRRAAAPLAPVGRVPLAALALATLAVAGLALSLPLIAAFSRPPRPAPDEAGPAR